MSKDDAVKFYGTLQARRVDLIGDFAGRELFLIDGDSLLLHLFSNPDLDFDSGFQLLHFVYAVENFLKQLLDRNANFDLVWFDANKDLCMPATEAAARNANKYHLARHVVAQHVDWMVETGKVGFKTHKFAAPEHESALRFYDFSGAYFMMCHDGANLEHHGERKTALRENVQTFVTNALSVALVNEITFQDTKVITQIVERTHKNPQRQSTSIAEDSQASNQATAESGLSDDDTGLLRELQDASRADPTLIVTQRTFLLTCACRSFKKRYPQEDKFVAAVLLHLILLQSLPLSNRRLTPAQVVEHGTDSQLTTNDFSTHVTALVDELVGVLRCGSAVLPHLECDVADTIDGRLLHHALQSHEAVGLSASLKAKYGTLCALVDVTPLHLAKEIPSTQLTSSRLSTEEEGTVLEFRNECFDTHLKDIKLDVTTRESKESPTTSKIFADLTHWHGTKSASTKAIQYLDERQLRRNQLHLTEMKEYAASLTGASGRSLHREIIAIDHSDKPAKSKTTALEIRAKSDASSSTPQGSKSGKKPKLTPAQLAKQMRFEKESAKSDAKIDKAHVKQFDAWVTKRKILDSIPDAARRYNATENYLADLPEEKRELLDAEVKLYAVCALVNALSTPGVKSSTSKTSAVLAHVAQALQDISRSQNLTSAEVKGVNDVAKHLRMPIEARCKNDSDRKLSFRLELPRGVATVQHGWEEFQLLYGGPYMDRSIDATDDDRVPFKPDAWQRKVLDELDRNNSVFVVAPTSAGKTFISFYAMRKILKANNDDVLVYLAPTKALVNQIAAEVEGRFTKDYPHAGNSVWAIHTRDHRINNPAGCQILVTVPHILQIMLLAPEMAKSWAHRVKRIIFDEIHCIGQADDGLVWEQLLLLAPCPIIALSATVGNPDEFSSWLTSTQQSLGNDLIKVEHKYRYSDLRKFEYLPPPKWDFKGIPEARSIGHGMGHGIEDPQRFAFIHPVAVLTNRSRGMPEDLNLEARDCLLLYNALKRVQTSSHPIAETLGPKSLPTTIAKSDIIQWERRLKATLRAWLADPASPFDNLVAELRDKRLSVKTGSSARGELDGADTDSDSDREKPESSHQANDQDDNDPLARQTLPLLISLQEQNALPAILFNYDRARCEDLCKSTLSQLTEAEDEWKETNPAWKKKLARFQQWKERKSVTTKKTSSLGKKAKNDADEGLSSMDRAMMAGEEDASEFENFDPSSPVELFSFANKKKLDSDTLAVYVRKLRWRHIDEYLIEALSRGLGVHHAGMNRAYRQAVEILFRQGYLRVIIATGTLALGINMPCKTVVFSGDSVYLTALNYRQAAGRAGRRGFDLLGNVVFHGLPREKVFRLMSSRLPDLNGHFPVTTTLVLRLFSLLHNSDYSPYARHAINALLSQPRIYIGATSFRQQVLHHLRFSIEYLRRQSLLAVRGQPINFAGMVSHLYYTENSGFALHQLLKSGYFHELSHEHLSNPEVCKEKLMLVLAHIFGRQICKVSDREYMAKDLKLSSSTVLLPEMPSDAKAILEGHNDSTRQIFSTYVRTFVKQHLADVDQHLPLSGMAFQGVTQAPVIAGLPEPQIRSAFVALSGHGDDFDSVGDLCSTVRSGVFLEKAVVPHLDIYPDEHGRQLNAYLYDYFRNEDIRALLEDNHIRRSDVWFLLNDFSLVLATIVASLNNYLTSKPISELSMMELKGGGDMAEVSKDDEQAADAGEATDAPKAVAPKPNGTTKKKAKKVADSWDNDDESSSSEEDLVDQDEMDPTPSSDGALRAVLNMFKDLQQDFNIKFRKMWA